jgi:hypothetical protein
VTEGRARSYAGNSARNRNITCVYYAKSLTVATMEYATLYCLFTVQTGAPAFRRALEARDQPSEFPCDRLLPGRRAPRTGHDSRRGEAGQPRNPGAAEDWLGELGRVRARRRASWPHLRLRIHSPRPRLMSRRVKCIR